MSSIPMVTLWGLPVEMTMLALAVILGLVQIVLSLSSKTMHRGLRIASEIEHREYQVANRCGLGMLYVELLAPERALRQLEKAQSLAEALRSRLWMHHITGTLAGTYRLLDAVAPAARLSRQVIPV